jgi:hypothetical protein
MTHHGSQFQHSQTYSHSQTSPPGQTTQSAQAYGHPTYPSDQAAHSEPQLAQKQGIKINATHVKQAAKGVLFAGGVLAKLNGVNLSSNS